MEYFIYCYGTQILTAILCAIAGCLGCAIKKLVTKVVNDDTKRAVAKTAAAFVEGSTSTARKSCPRPWKPPKRCSKRRASPSTLRKWKS